MTNRSHPSARRRRAYWLLGLVVLALGASTAPARAGEEVYDPKRAGNPVRIAAYILSPFGVFLDYAIMRPAWWIGSHEPWRTIFGRNNSD